MFRSICLSFAIMLGLAMPAHADWELLGTQQGDYKKDIDIIKVGGRDRYTKLRVCGENSRMNVKRLVIVFGNGKEQKEKGINLRKGTCQRYDLKGRKRKIDHIKVKWGKVRDSRPPLIKIYGREG